MADPVPPPGNAPLTYGQVLTPNTGPAKDPNMSGGSFGPLPAFNDGMTYAEVGASGLRAFSGWVREEFLTALQGRLAAQKYREMMDNSPIVGALMQAITSSMRKVEWRTLPANSSPEAQQAAEFIDSCRDDMSHTWSDLVVENLSMLGYGYAPHEIVYKKRLGRDPGKGPNGRDLGKSDYDDGLIGWRKIPLRGQDTVLKWFFDENGEIRGITQQPWTGAIIDIPMEKMLLFRPSQHKGNPEGRSILRSSYVPYYFVKRLQEQEAILGERLGGLPCVKVPSTLIQAAADGDSKATAAIAAYQKMTRNVRIDEQMGILLPSDVFMGANGPTSVHQYSFELITPVGGRGSALNFDVSILRYNTGILTSALADFLLMGHNTRGAQNLGETKLDLFFQAVEGYLNSNAEIYNRYAIPRLWRLNGFDMDIMPRIEPDMATRVDLDMLSNFVLRMSQAGMPMFPNEELQAYILDAAGLPDVQDERAVQAAGLTEDQLNLEDDKNEALADNIINPQTPVAQPVKPAGGGFGKRGGRTRLEKMLLASLARRVIRQQGNRFDIRKYSPDEARDDHGRWASGGTGVVAGKLKASAGKLKATTKWAKSAKGRKMIAHGVIAASAGLVAGTVENYVASGAAEHIVHFLEYGGSNIVTSGIETMVASVAATMKLDVNIAKEFIVSSFDRMIGLVEKDDGEDAMIPDDVLDVLKELRDLIATYPVAKAGWEVPARSA